MAPSAKAKRKPRKTRSDEVRSRNGAKGGRPRESGPPGIAWGTVRRYARLGVDRDTIVTALGIADELRKPEVVLSLQRELDRGAALHRVDLLEDVEVLRKDGSVNATLASLREKLDWSKHDDGRRDAHPPDDEAALAELQTVIARFRLPCA